MKKFALLLCLLLATLQARADLVIVYSMEVGGQSQDFTTKIKGNKAVVLIPGAQMSSIIDLDTGDSTTIISQAKKYMKMSAAKMKEMTAAMKKAKAATSGAPAQPEESPKIVDTGKAEKVNGFDAEIYTVDTAEGKVTLWMSKSIPNYASVIDQMKKLQTIQNNMSGQSMDLSKLDGIPVKMVTTMSGQTMTMTFVSAKEEAVPDSDVSVPADFTEMQMPSMPAGAPAQ